MSGIDKDAYASKLSRVRTGHKLLFSGVLLIVCLAFGSDLVSTLVIVLMSAATLILGGCRPGRYIRLLAVPAVFLLTGVLTVVVTRLGEHEGALLSVNLLRHAYGVTPDALRRGATLLLKAFAAVTCLYFFALNTPMNAFLTFLRKKLPGVVVELMELIYRFIFIIWEEAAKIRVAQASRLGYSGFRNSMTSTGELVTGVFLRAMRRADRMNAAAESRGFEGDFSFLAEEETPSRLLIWCAVLSGAVLIAAGILERLLK